MYYFLPLLGNLTRNVVSSVARKVGEIRTDSTPTSSGTLRYLKTLKTRSGERLPTISNVARAYFSNSRI